MDISFLAQTPLFQTFSVNDIEKLIDCLDVQTRSYQKGCAVFLSGETIREIGLVLSGSVRIENIDVFGNRSILAIISRGGVFAETYALLPQEPMMVDVIANENTDLLFIRTDRLFQMCQMSCKCHSGLIQNLLFLSAKKNLQLSQRILDTSSKTIRGRLLSYLSREVSRQGSHTILIPFDRQQLADYLSLDRSALSKELSKMKAEGLLDYHKNRFTIHIRQ